MSSVVVKNMPKKRKRKNSPVERLGSAIIECTKSGDIEGALAHFNSATAIGSNAVSGFASYHLNCLLHLISSHLHSLPSSESRASAVSTAAHIHDLLLSTPGTTAISEATITSLARIAASPVNPCPNPCLAFELVSTMQMKHAIPPRLRTYGPALFAFCRSLDAENAYCVEDHMFAAGISLEEAEIAALLDMSSRVGNADKVYEYLLKLRGVADCVSAETAEVLERWFCGESAAEVGCGKWNEERVKGAIMMNGGGCHGVGWLGKGKWHVQRGAVTDEGTCLSCGEKLACVDLGIEDSDRFVELVAAFALEREAQANFKEFQEWLDTNDGYDAVVDAANVGFYQQNFANGGFSLWQVESVVNELRERNKGRFPLIVLHQKRMLDLMAGPLCELLDTWKTNGALYATPVGSNDDWYWLYAAIKLKCLLVTNDEMRDHIFEILGSRHFLKWKERHQVHYTFNKDDLKFAMPPPYSTCIQESEVGSWHVPINGESDVAKKLWLCITRLGSLSEVQENPVRTT